MALDKVVDSVALDADILSVADAIRSKSGGSDPLAWPDGFASAIQSIQTGGGVTASGSNDVNFRDYDGTIVASYSASDFANISSLPDNPTHKGLTSQGWNWSIEDAKAYVAEYGKLEIGQMYITDDGKTRIHIHLEDGNLSPMLGCCPNGSVVVDWGDGSSTDTLTGSNTSVIVWTGNHDYSAPGDYVIALTVTGEMCISGSNNPLQGSAILRKTKENDGHNRSYLNAITEINIGDGVTKLNNYSFNHCAALSRITIPSGATSILSNVFSNCYLLSSVTIPSSVTETRGYIFSYCYSLSSVSFPNSVTKFDGAEFTNCCSCRLSSIIIPRSATSISFNSCYALSSIKIPSGVTSIGNNAFYCCYALSSVTIPSLVTSIGNSAFFNCYCVEYYDFSNHTSIPTLSNTNAFYNIAPDCKMLIPSALYDEWSAATNWATYADYMVAV